MKILLLNDERWDSGITSYFIQVGRLLSANGNRVVMGVRDGERPHQLAKEAGVESVRVESAFDLLKLLRRSPWDVVNPHTGRTHTWAWMVKKWMSRGKDVALIRTRGDARPLKLHPLAKRLYRETNAVIAASDHIRRYYEMGLGLNEEELRTIYPSVDVDPRPSDLPHKVVGILGRLDPVKGHTVFLEAAAKVLKVESTVKFMIAGKDAGVSSGLLANHARQLGIEKSVRFLGYQPSARAFIRTCGVGVISSLGSEEVSRACLEWMAEGRPVVGTVVGCLPEIIEPQETGLLVPANDSFALAESVLKFVQQPSLAEKWGKAGWRLAQRRFSPTIQTEKTFRIFNWALERARNGSHGR